MPSDTGCWTAGQLGRAFEFVIVWERFFLDIYIRGFHATGNFFFKIATAVRVAVVERGREEQSGYGGESARTSTTFEWDVSCLYRAAQYSQILLQQPGFHSCCSQLGEAKFRNTELQRLQSVHRYDFAQVANSQFSVGTWIYLLVIVDDQNQ